MRSGFRSLGHLRANGANEAAAEFQWCICQRAFLPMCLHYRALPHYNIWCIPSIYASDTEVSRTLPIWPFGNCWMSLNFSWEIHLLAWGLWVHSVIILFMTWDRWACTKDWVVTFYKLLQSAGLFRPNDYVGKNSCVYFFPHDICYFRNEKHTQKQGLDWWPSTHEK